MMSKKMFTELAILLANGMYLRRCDDLEEVLQSSFKAAFEGEKISNERRDRIASKFYDLMLGEKVNMDE